MQGSRSVASNQIAGLGESRKKRRKEKKKTGTGSEGLEIKALKYHLHRKRKMASKGVRLLLLLSWVAGPEVLSDILRPSCAPGWFYYRSHCYGYFRKLRNWSHAELECQSYGNGSHLASVLNQKEASVISKYITGYQRNLPVWIGLHDPQKKQLWQWTDGSTNLYRRWNPRTKSEARHCAEMNPKDKFLTWNKNGCANRQHFLCKYKT